MLPLRKERELTQKGLTNGFIAGNSAFRPIEPDKTYLKDISASLELSIYGQPKAIDSLSSALLRSYAGMDVPDRPLFSGLFAGPPGVGKTEMGKALTRLYHPGDEYWESYLRIIDCSNLKGDDSVNRLIGSPPGYVGSGNPDLLLVHPEFFRENAKTVVIFDEFEKAHIAIWRQLLSVLDRGRLQITAGTKQYSEDTCVVDTNWTNTAVVFTTNIGSRDMVNAKNGKSLGFAPRRETIGVNEIKTIGENAVRKYFERIPEFLDRLDEIVIFNHLDPESYAKILDKFINQLNVAQKGNNNPLFLTDEAKQYVVSLVSANSGGRGLRRILDQVIVTPAAAVKLSIDANLPIVAGYDSKRGVIFWVGEFEEEAVNTPKFLTAGR